MTFRFVKPELRGVEAKLDRAGEHLDTLDAKVRKFIERDAPSIAGQYEPETSCYSFKITFGERPGLDIGVVLGDVVHNLRSALDHLVWQLVLKANRTPGNWTRFPLCERRRTFTEQVTSPGRRGRRNPLLGLEGTPAWAAIEALQPYHRGHTHELLLALHDLSNEDKHRVVLQTVSGVKTPPNNRGFTLAHNADVGETLETLLMTGEPLEDGAEVIRVRIVPTGPDPQVVMDGQITLEIGFGERAILGDRLPEMARTVRTVVDDFDRRLF